MAVLMSGCATTSNQHQATIRGTINEQDGKKIITEVKTVDGRSIGLHFMVTTPSAIPPGAHSVNATLRAIPLNDQPLKESEVNLRFTADAGHDYDVAARFNGEHVNAWITDSNGRAVSSVRTAEILSAGPHKVEVNELKRR